METRALEVTRDDRVREVLAALGIARQNAAACDADGWMQGDAHVASIDPATGRSIAEVGTCSQKQYERVMRSAATASMTWQTIPAPQRGAIVRMIGDELRRHKDALGTLISLETGKIKAEG